MSGQDSIIARSFGCRLNAYETEVMKRRATDAGLGDLPGGVVLVNTCAVTGEAVRQAKQAVRRMRREKPDARIVVSGCAAQTEAESFAAMDEVDLVLGNEEKLHAHHYRALSDFKPNQPGKMRVGDIMQVRDAHAGNISRLSGHSRAFLQVQNGCDHRCTFCVIPYGRGNSRSVPASQVVEQAKILVANGYREVVLTGVDTTSYGADLEPRESLGTLVQLLLRSVPDLPRLRLSSIDSIEVDEPLMEAIGHVPRFMPHLHLSLQHGDDLILKRMKRRHLRDHSIAFCDQVRRLRPDISLGADLIAGFPTEDETMFENTLRLVEECGLDFVHVFPFSPRPMTPAAKMPQLDKSVVKERAARLRAVADQRFASHLNCMVGKVADVLVERGETGRTPHFTPVAMPGYQPGALVTMEMVGHGAGRLTAKPVVKEALAHG